MPALVTENGIFNVLSDGAQKSYQEAVFKALLIVYIMPPMSNPLQSVEHIEWTHDKVLGKDSGQRLIYPSELICREAFMVEYRFL